MLKNLRHIFSNRNLPVLEQLKNISVPVKKAAKDISYVWVHSPNFRKLVIGSAVFLLMVLLLILIPQWQAEGLPKGISPKDAAELENKFRTTIAQIFGGLLVLVGLYLTWRRIVATDKNVEVAQKNFEIARRTLSVTEKGHVTERFTRAIDQLGSEKLEIRLGGIYALEKIARDYEDYHWTIMEILTAYVRENSPVKKPKGPGEESNNEQGLVGENGHEREGETPSEKIATDIQAILTVIGRRKRTYGKGEDQRINLSSADIHGAHLLKTNLMKANLKGADLQRANLVKINLVGAYLWEANLGKAYLREAILEGAFLWRANLTGADFEKADIRGVKYWTVEELSKVRTLYKAKLDPELEKQVKEKYPHLLEKPED